MTRRAARRTAVAPARTRAIRQRLLTWYDRNRRDLPWRRRGNEPYAQWVAEIMLQQTQVATVRSYYERFLRQFPDVRSLARASRQRVLKSWEGLGYYRRAVHLHIAAQQVVAAGGSLPENRDGLRALPGIGNYTSAAIASIAYGEPVAAVDGNVVRVVSRLFKLVGQAKTNRLRAGVQHIAEQLLDPHRPGDFNQAWMDLGATLCRPRDPRCSACPLSSLCLGRLDRRRDRAPRANAPRQAPVVVQTVLIARCGEALFMRRRPESGLWAGLWEFPALDGHDVRAEQLLASCGLRALGPAVPLEAVERRLTHRLYCFHPLLISADDARPRPRSDARMGRWVPPRQRARLPVSTAHRKLLSLINVCG